MSARLHTDRKIYDTVLELGSQKAAAEALGMSGGYLSARMRVFEEETGLRLPSPVRRGPDRTAQAISQQAVLDALARIEAKVDALASARPALAVTEWRPDHKRIADGGEQVTSQRKRVTGRRR